MNNVLPLVLAMVAGLLLGAFYFGGLWWTVRKGVTSACPALLFSVSLLLRTSVTLVGFYVVGHAHWKWLVVCLVGFIAARMLILWLDRMTVETSTRSAREARHAS